MVISKHRQANKFLPNCENQGNLIDSKLFWKKYIPELTKKVNRVTALLAEVRNYVHENLLKLYT